MKALKISLLAGLFLLPASLAARAADYTPPDTAANSAMMGFYLRGDAGLSFLKWSGGSDDNGFVGGVGIGYRYNPNMRTDLTVDWSGKYDVAPGAKMSTTAVLGNLYFDWANDSAFTPYIGAGVGYGWVNNAPQGDKSGLALGLSAGVAVDLTDNVALDVGYRFRDTMISGNNPKEHQATVGIRFSF
jgi:opacity protein-like surface antigen